ncbi:hypothetical protein D9Q98_007005 [Chlorella vulgaris]|uniref:RING-type E3 ubiquitin transferase n=1 Tax=Chlorella vulgaris TaxID=3077 RepID=A0A9D4TJ96_CHLVU|nr:hypothetical protein D9Q98_007005 [Chlorella vulgaris]
MWRALVLALCGLSACAEAMVVMQTGNFTLEFPSLPADFGKPIPPEGLTGLLLLAQPEDACSQLKPPRKSGAPWIALIARSQEKDGCTFDIKVAHAEAAGAVAAVVYDDVFEPLILMAKDPRHPDPFIPSAFVTQKSGILMKRLMVEGETIVTLTPLSEALWLSMIMSAAAGFLAVNVVLGVLWVIRRQHVGGGGVAAARRPPPRQGMTASEIRALPIVVFEESGPASVARSGAAALSSSGGGEEAADEEGQQQAQGGSDSGSDSGARGGGTRHVCAICLENYGPGDKLRVLPCQHRYHVGCVDQWLSARRPVCPVCKQDAHAAAAAAESESDEEAEAAAGQGAGGAGRPAAGTRAAAAAGGAAGGDLEAGQPPAAQQQQQQQRSRRRRRHSRRGAGGFLLGRLATGWAALRSQLLGVPAADNGSGGRAGGGVQGGPADEPQEQRQQLLAGSRTNSPILGAGGAVGAGARAAGASGTAAEAQHSGHSGLESAATLTNFPAFFPPRRAASSAHPEIVPAEGEEAQAAPAVPARASGAAPGTWAAAVAPAAAPFPFPGSSGGGSSSRRGLAFGSAPACAPLRGLAGGAHSHLVQVEQDSTEGSETDSEAE